MNHEVDVPITDLDAEDDDGLSSISELDANVLREDFDSFNTGDPGFSFGRDSFLTRFKSSLIRLLPNTGLYQKVPIATNGIELSNRNFNDVDSFDLSDEEFILKRQSGNIIKSFLSKLGKFTLYFLILILIIVVIVLSVLISKKPKSFTSKQLLSNGTHNFYPTTLLISLDGFHPHYISQNLTPALHKMFMEEYGAPYMIPSFPSSTFPNHWTIATGLYPEHHGIVGNKFYDPVSKKKFINVLPENSLDPEFWGGEPIWSTAELNSVKSAIHMFPGSEVVFESGNPSIVDKFNGSEVLENKVSRISEWLDRDLLSRPELIISYVPTIDSVGHKYGIHGKELESNLTYVDNFINEIQSIIESRNLTDILNLIIVSDHGMAPTSEERLVYLDDLLQNNTSKIQYIDGWPLYGLRPYEEFSVADIYDELISNFKENSGYNIYLKENLPKHLKFGNAKTSENSQYYDRIAPIWIIPDVGYSITTHDDMERKNGKYTPKGVHGYDNSEVLMRAIFLGQGPYFKNINSNSFKIKPFQNIEVYNILCDTLDLKPSANDGESKIFENLNNHLADWKDPLSYPNVEFDLKDFINADDSTYDLLFRNDYKQTTTLQPEETSNTDTATNEPTQDEPAQEGPTEDKKPEGEQEPESDDLPELVNQQDPEDSDDEGSEDKEEEDSEDEEEKSEEKSKEKEGKPDHKSIWDKIGDVIDDIEEDLEEIGDDVKEQIDDWVDDIEDAFGDAFKFI